MPNIRLKFKPIFCGAGLWLASALFAGLYAQSSFTLLKDTSNRALTFPNTPARYKGAAWIDLNQDNRPDLFVCQRFLFRNEGQGKFTQLPDVTTTHGAQGAAGSAWGDIDNDGDPDVILAARNSGLYRNDGTAGFVNISNNLPGLTETFPSWDCTLADADNNGRLDPLFVHARGFHGNSASPNKFFLQGTDGQFSAQSGWTFTDSLAPYTIPTWSDYDLDGDQDLFIGSGPGGRPGFDYCFQNMLHETGKFDFKRLQSYPFNEPQDGQVYSFPDVDNDGDLDLCLSNYSGAVSGLWRNDGGKYVPWPTPFSNRRSYLSNNWADLDNDGDLDVLFTRDSANYVHCFWNDGKGAFQETQTPTTSVYGLAGVSLADYDNDGDLDMYTNGAGEARSLFRNELPAGTQRHWLQITLQGTPSNRSALGARVALKAGGQWQMRTVQAHTSFQGHNDLRVHFGLGAASVVDSLKIFWPSGQVDRFSRVAVDQFLKSEEAQNLHLIPEQVVDLKVRVLSKPGAKKSILQINMEHEIQALFLVNGEGESTPMDFTQKGNVLQITTAKKLESGMYYLNVWIREGLKLRGRLSLGRL